VWWYIPQLLQEAQNRRTVVHLGQKQDSVTKIMREKMAGSMTKAVKHLLSKCEVLCLNPSTTEKKKKKNEEFYF
jgi:hypothetical protein